MALTVISLHHRFSHVQLTSEQQQTKSEIPRKIQLLLTTNARMTIMKKEATVLKYVKLKIPGNYYIGRTRR